MKKVTCISGHLELLHRYDEPEGPVVSGQTGRGVCARAAAGGALLARVEALVGPGLVQDPVVVGNYSERKIHKLGCHGISFKREMDLRNQLLSIFGSLSSQALFDLRYLRPGFR